MTENDLRQGLFRIAGDFAPAVSNVAKVKSVNEAECTCVLQDEDGQEIPDVRLRAVVGENKSLLNIPKIGAFVLAVRVEDSEDWCVVACEEVAKTQILNENLTVEISEGKVKIQNGNVNFKQCLNDVLMQLKNAIILTPNGPGKFSDADKLQFDNFKNKINQILY